MIIARIKGGLGNQLFQYAAGYSLAKRLHQEMSLDISFFSSQTLRGYKLDLLKIDNRKQIKKIPLQYEVERNKYINKLFRVLHISQVGRNDKYLLETKSEIISDFFNIEAKNIYLDGYYQSDKYFTEVRYDILRQFTPMYEFDEEFNSILSKIRKTNSIAVHVRRGDFVLTQGNSNPNRYVLDKEYYVDAMRKIESLVDDPVYYWFSDDMDWVKDSFGDNKNFRYISLSTRHPDIDEMMLMKECKHIVTANSTFSWWAAWMNDKRVVICPKRRYGNIEMIPDSWIKV